MPRAANTRRYHRRRFVRRATVEIPGPGPGEVTAVPGTFESLSEGGAGFALDGEIPVALGRGHRVDLCFFSASPGQSSRAARVPARVAWARRRDGQLRVGAELLVESLTGAQLKLMKGLLAGPDADAAGSPAFAAEGER